EWLLSRRHFAGSAANPFKQTCCFATGMAILMLRPNFFQLILPFRIGCLGQSVSRFCARSCASRSTSRRCVKVLKPLILHTYFRHRTGHSSSPPHPHGQLRDCMEKRRCSITAVVKGQITYVSLALRAWSSAVQIRWSCHRDIWRMCSSNSGCRPGSCPISSISRSLLIANEDLCILICYAREVSTLITQLMS